MKLTYICHSGFLLEFENAVLVIDYFKDSAPKEGVTAQLLENCTKKLYVLSSHIHGDHYNPEILRWQEKQPEITYLFSRDILEETGNKTSAIHYIDKLEEYRDNEISVKAYGSTDEGISFYIQADGKAVFHAGDLNNWHWNEEAAPEESKGYEDHYHAELALIAKDVKALDLALFPVDPRLGADYMRGPEEFLESIEVAAFAPMHFGAKYSAAKAFQPIAEKKGCRFLDIREKGQEFIL